MGKTIRIIPRLDIKGPNLVKGIHLEGLRVLGKPEQYARYYYEAGADELAYIDVVASLYNRNSLHDIISRTAREIFIPLMVGGGLRTIEDIRAVLRAGADKVSINTAAINNPQIISEAANIFGSSTIVVSIPVIAHGGAGSIGHIKQVILEGKADAVAVASLLHYNYLIGHKIELGSEKEGNTEFISNGIKSSKINSADLSGIKKYLFEQGINCRIGENCN